MHCKSFDPVSGTEMLRDVLARNEILIDVFIRHAPDFAVFRDKGGCRIMASLVTVEQAARVAKVPAAPLLADLNRTLRVCALEAAVRAQRSA